MSQQGKGKLKICWSRIHNKGQTFSCELYAHSQFLCSSVANLAFLKADFEILTFIEHLCLSLETKKLEKSGFFFAYYLSDRLASGKTLSELYIHYKSFATKVYYHAGCTEYCKNFTVALKMIDVIDKKQMHDSAIMGKEYPSKNWTCVISMFLTSFIVYFVCGCGCFICICLRTATWVYLAFLGQGLAFFGEDRLATLLCTPARFDLASRGVSHPVQPHTYARLLFFNTEAKFCSYELLCRSIELIFLWYPDLESW